MQQNNLGGRLTAQILDSTARGSEPLVRRRAQESVALLKLTGVSQTHSPDWEPRVWQVLENLIFPEAPASHKSRFSAQPALPPTSPPPQALLEAGWSRRSDCDATRRRVGGGRADRRRGAPGTVPGTAGRVSAPSLGP